MKKNLTQLLLGVCLAMVSFTLSAQTSCINYFNDIEVNPAMCGDDNGSITIASETAGVDFQWNDGSTELNRENLPAGIYTVVGEDEKGCQEEITLSIPDIAACQFVVYETYPISPPKIPGKDACVTLHLQVYQNGQLVPLDNFYINWTVTGSQSSYTSSESSVDVFENGAEVELISYYQLKDGTVVPCCVHYWGKTITNACPIKPKVYVYKANFGFRENTIRQFELFVYGNGVCGETMDLRGYIIDDNNGELIPPASRLEHGDFVNANDGFFRFSDHENWSAVPNGSFINIYYFRDNCLRPFEEKYCYPGLVKSYDPTDANNDGVYVVGMNDFGGLSNYTGSEFIDAYSSTWDFSAQVVPYSNAKPSELYWNYIDMDGPGWGIGDALQIRNPDGTYHHGVAHGVTNYSVQKNEFPLHITYDVQSSFRIHMDRMSHDDKTAYSVVDGGTTFTPGTVESPDMQEVVKELRSCNEGKRGAEGRSALISEEVNKLGNSKKDSNSRSLEVHPNPFKQYLDVTFQSDVEGRGVLHVYNNQGKLVKNMEVTCTKELQQQRIDFGHGATSGLYFIQLHYPNSKTKTAKAVLISDK